MIVPLLMQMMMPWWTTIGMPSMMDLDHLMFADHWEMCQGRVGGECGVVGEGQGAELSTAFFWIVQRAAGKKQGNVLGVHE